MQIYDAVWTVEPGEVARREPTQPTGRVLTAQRERCWITRHVVLEPQQIYIN